MTTYAKSISPVRSGEGLLTGKNQRLIGLLLAVALVAFELFNFDTTQFALADLLGDVRFVGLRWATILAVAFCAIDFAGLARLFSPSSEQEANREIWYLMGAWLLGATMNAMMTWWAVSLTLLNHNLGNEVLSRSQLLEFVPLFVAVLVWLTRILFIGAMSAAGGQFLARAAEQPRIAQDPLAKAPIRAEPAPVERTGDGLTGIFRRSPDPGPGHVRRPNLEPAMAASPYRNARRRPPAYAQTRTPRR